MICKLSKIWRLYEEVKTLYGDYGGYIGKFRAIIGCWRFYGTKVGIELLWQLKTAELVYWGILMRIRLWIRMRVWIRMREV